jgi:PAS domain S-box
MKDIEKTKEELIEEVKALRLQAACLKEAQRECMRISREFQNQQKLLRCANKAKYYLLTERDHNIAINNVLAMLGMDMKVDRVYIFGSQGEDGKILFKKCFSWNREGFAPAEDYAHSYTTDGAPEIVRWYETLSAGDAVKVVVRELPDYVKVIFQRRSVVSLLNIPILIGDKFCGFMGFENCVHERIWSDNEVSVLTTLAAAIGGFIEHKDTEESIKKSEVWFRLLVENSEDIISVFDSSGEIIYVSSSIGRISGFSYDQVVHKSIYDLISPEYTAKAGNTIDSISKVPMGIRQVEFSIKCQDGKLRYLEGTIKNLIDEPSVRGIVGNLKDITLRKLAEQALANEKERLLVTLGSIGEGVITIDTEGTVVLINKVAEDYTGWTQKEAAGKPIGEILNIIDQKTRQRYENPLGKILNPRGITGVDSHTILLDRNGIKRIISDAGALIRDENNNILGTVIVLRDITDKLRMENELLKASKIESVGLLAGGIAHDFNNILTVIMGNISLTQMYLKSGNIERIYDRLDDMENASIQAKGLTQQLLTFARGGAPVVKKASIVNVLKQTASFALSGSNIKCEFSLPDGLWPALIDEGQISQVINNLIINAKQAMPDGGIIDIRAENFSVGKDSSLLVSPGNYILISVEDHGCGVPQEYISKIFDPYFTTKATGTGLGLSTSYSIIKKHGGFITLESILGVRTTFYVYLPALPQQSLKKEGKKGELVCGTGAVLIMDDEESVRNVLKGMLTQLGYKVSCAKDGVETIKAYENARENAMCFDAVIMDLTIPGGMGGKETVRELIKLDPEVKAIVSSGYSNDPIMGEYRGYGFMGVVTKPYKIEELSREVYRVIAGLDI